MASSTERSRDRRDRLRSGGNPVRAFLNAVVRDTEASVANPESETPPWRLARASTAVELLGLLDERPVPSSPMVAFITSWAPDMTVDQLEREFRVWLAGPKASAKARRLVSPVTKQAELALSWAESERVAG